MPRSTRLRASFGLGALVAVLKLFGPPAWTSASGIVHPVPSRVPAALLIYLAAMHSLEGMPMSREAVASVFWGDAAPEDALRSLRVTLNRVRDVLMAWGADDTLDAGRTHIRLVMPSDLDHAEERLCALDVATMRELAPSRWLAGFDVPSLDGFHRWVEAQRERWSRRWHGAVDLELRRALCEARVEFAAQVMTVWREEGGAALPMVTGLDASELAPAARALLAAARTAAPASDLQGRSPPPGREREAGALVADTHRAVFVVGEPGIGKTTLLRSMFGDAPWIEAREGTRGTAFAAVARALSARFDELSPLVARDAPLWAYRLDLARFEPRFAPGEPLPALDARTAKLRQFEALEAAFAVRGPAIAGPPRGGSAPNLDRIPRGTGGSEPSVRGGPSCIGIDDLQWLDDASLEWLAFLAQGERLRWCAAARTGEMAPSARQQLESLRRAGRLAEHRLDGLEASAFDVFCRRKWPGRPWTSGDIESLRQRSGGNPFFAITLAQSVREHGDAAPVGALNEVLSRTLDHLDATSRLLVEAAAVLEEPSSLELLSRVTGVEGRAALTACEDAVARGILVDDLAGLRCRHDLIRHAAAAALTPTKKSWLHLRAAETLAAIGSSPPDRVARHFDAAGDRERGCEWWHRSASRLRLLGRFDEAKALWQRVVDDTGEPALLAEVQIALAECDLFEDLDRGRAALEALLPGIAALRDAAIRQRLEARALAALVDNAVFHGDADQASTLSQRLTQLLPQLDGDDAARACEVLLERSMRLPGQPGASALLARMRGVPAARVQAASFEAQSHWFAGRLLDARRAFERMLAQYPQYCRGITIENDFAVTLHALGELDLAETMARRSLRSWAGVPHTETLSRLVLGSVLTSAGRHDEARSELAQALALGREQGSARFESEAQVRLARLEWMRGHLHEAQRWLDTCAAAFEASTEPLRASSYWQLRASVDAQRGVLDANARDVVLARLRDACAPSTHPVVQARRLRGEWSIAACGDREHEAHALAEELQRLAQAHAMREWARDADELVARHGR